jgi:hypothetical protein
MEAGRTISCPHCGEALIAEARFCSSCGNALPTGWEEPRLFTHDEGSSLGVGFELREAVLALEVPSGCARRFFGVLLGLGLLSAVSWSVALGHPLAQDLFPPILLGLVWIEVIGVFGLWVWSRTQPYAAALTGFVFFLTGAVVSSFSALQMLGAAPLYAIIFALVIQILSQGVFLWVAYRVVRSSRNPLGPSKLSTPLGLHPVGLEPAPAAVRDELAERQRQVADEAPSVATPDDEKLPDQRPSRQRSARARTAPLLASLQRRSAELIRAADERMPSWLRPLPLRVFQAVIVAVVIYQLNRVATVITGPRGRFFPFRRAVLFAPIVALADAVVGGMVSFRLIRGFVKLIGDPVVDRAYWLKHLPHLAVMFGGLASLRVVSVALAVASGRARLASPNGDFFVILVFDLAMVALSIVGHRLWTKSVLPGKP